MKVKEEKAKERGRRIDQKLKKERREIILFCRRDWRHKSATRSQLKDYLTLKQVTSKRKERKELREGAGGLLVIMEFLQTTKL